MMTQASPWEFFYLTPKVAEEDESNLGLWVGIIVAVVVVGVVVWLIIRSRRGGPAEEV
jgi:cytochrome c-type biogenesis protein CcmH/NrfF